MYLEAGSREGATDEHFLSRAFDTRTVGKLIAQRSTDPDVHLD